MSATIVALSDGGEHPFPCGAEVDTPHGAGRVVRHVVETDEWMRQVFYYIDLGGRDKGWQFKARHVTRRELYKGNGQKLEGHTP